MLLHKEQGLGDMIMFASCIGDIAAADRQLHLAVQPPLARLFAHNFPQAQVWASASRAGEEDFRHQRWLAVAGRIDCQLPLASLGLLTRSQGFPAPKPYLAPLPYDAELWAKRVAVLEGSKRAQLRAGLVYMARRDGVMANGVADGDAKSLSAAAVGQLALVEGVQWFGLHDRATADALADIHGLDLIDTSPWLCDMADTAALIAQLDIVVAVDTAVAHLAGAMGKPVILMLRNKADWRWGRHRADSYWYPDVRIVRQKVEGDWWSVTAQVADLLRAFQAELCAAIWPLWSSFGP